MTNWFHGAIIGFDGYNCQGLAGCNKLAKKFFCPDFIGWNWGAEGQFWGKVGKWREGGKDLTTDGRIDTDGEKTDPDYRVSHPTRTLTRAGPPEPDTQTDRTPGGECSAIVGHSATIFA